MSIVKIVSILGVFLCAGCSFFETTSELSLNPISVPKKWSMVAGKSNSVFLPNDWNEAILSFNDHLLPDVLNRALESNSDIYIANLNIEKARTTTSGKFLEYLPTLSSSTSINNQKYIQNGISMNTSSADLTLSWNIGSWGSAPRTIDKYKWSECYYKSEFMITLTDIIYEVASTYWSLAAYNEKIRLQRKNISTYNDILSQVLSKYNAGLISEDEVLLAKNALLQQESILHDLFEKRLNDKNKLQTLLDIKTTNEKFIYESQYLPRYNDFSEWMLKKPINVLKKRPDIIAAYSLLKEGEASVDVAKKSFLPELSFSNVLTSAFNTSQSLNTLTLNVIYPFLSSGTLLNNLKSERVQLSIYKASLLKSVLEAIESVNNSLIQRRTLVNKLIMTDNAIMNAKKQELLSENKWRAGLIDLKTLLSYRAERISNEYDELSIREDLLVATFKLLIEQGILIPTDNLLTKDKSCSFNENSFIE
ncbi:TolC family protein [Escherichia coli O13]|nr:TolC family protein [Escherichia coli O13]